MERRGFLAGSVGVLVLSAGLILMTATASSGSTAQAWDENHQGAGRFTVLKSFGGAAVRDNNTGLVWEQAPDGTFRKWGPGIGFDPDSATLYCANRIIGGQKGWRLPSMPELASLIEPNAGLPTNLPFSNSQPFCYWSATAVADNPGAVWGVNCTVSITSPTVAFMTLLYKIEPARAWCVRGGMNADQY